jgi:hypothetical protein
MAIQQHLTTGIRTFSDCGYEILDERLLETGELVIWSVDSLVPRLGDRFTIESGGEIHDVAVYAITIFRGGWSVTCRLCGC